MRRLAGRVAVITGSTRGLGLAIAQAYAREGAAVVLAGRSAETLAREVAALRQGGAQASGLVTDVGALAPVCALAMHALLTFGSIDLWVNNAGVAGPYGPTAALAPEQFERVIGTNILGTYHGSLVALQHLLAAGRGGTLINVVGRGERGPVTYQNAYAASKAWVRNFTLALAREYAGTGIGIHTLNPGLMDTTLMRRIEAVAGYEAQLAPLGTVLRLWANPPTVAAERAVWLAVPTRARRTGLQGKVLTPVGLAGGILREAARRLRRQPTPRFPLEIITVPPYTLQS